MNPEDLTVLTRYVDEEVAPQYAFSDVEYAERKRKLLAEMKRRGITVVLLSSPEAQCWLHGYQARWYRTGSSTAWPPLNFTAVHESGEMVVIDSEDHERLVRFTSRAPRIATVSEPGLKQGYEAILAVLYNTGWVGPSTRWGIEKWSPRQNAATTEFLSRLLRIAGHDAPDDEWVVDFSVSMRRLQRIKSPAEIEVLKRAAGFLDHAYEVVVPTLRRDMTEIQVWAAMEHAMAEVGGETSGLHNTVSRTRSYYHALSSTRPIGTGQLHLDPCGVLHRYHVNTARQLYLEDAHDKAPPQLREASTVAADAIDVLKAVAKVGVPFSQVGAALQKHYEDAGLWGLRDWIGGYQLGIAFPPDWVGEFVWNASADDESDGEWDTYDVGDVEAKKVKTVENGLVTNFESFVGGAGFIDTVIFTDDGVEVLSQLPRYLRTV